MDKDLKTGLWNIFYTFLYENFQYEFEKYFKSLWTDHFKKRLDKIVKIYDEDIGDRFYDEEATRKKFVNDCSSLIEKSIFSDNKQWWDIYNLIQFSLENFPEQSKDDFKKAVNFCLKRERAAYRIVGNQVSSIIDDSEIEAIESAINDSTVDVAGEHLKKASTLLLDRDKPDYRNSIKESISAVEAVCRYVSGEEKATLSDCLKVIKKNTDIHPAFEVALDKLYGYTSDEGGIRHSLNEGSREIPFSEAKFMLVVCSAFKNYYLLTLPSK